MVRVADVIAQTLKAYDTEYFFCVTGGDHALWFALADAGIRVINCRSEQGAVYMADGYARITGKPGFVYGQYGPGVANVAGALADAYWSQSPVISLTSSIRTSSRDRFEYQEFGQLPMHASFTKFNRDVHRGDRAAGLLRGAIRAATSSPPGPAHLEVPADLLPANVEPEAPYSEAAFGRVPGLRTAPPTESIRQVVDAVLGAERPVMIAGTGVLLSEAWQEATALAESMSLPVATSNGGKGTISEDHDLSLGLVGRYSRKVANDIVREADLALVIGSRLGGMVTDSYTVPTPSARILHVDVDPEVLGATYREELSVLGDAKLALRSMLEEVERRGLARGRTAWARETAARVADWKDALSMVASGTGAPIHPATVMLALRAVLRPDDILAVDTGFVGAWAGAVYPVGIGRNYLRATGSLGWAFPAALGATLGDESRRVVCVTGDGGFGYHLPELETAVRAALPTLILVLNNSSLGFEYITQQYLWGGRLLSHQTDYERLDYSQLARDFGAYGERVTNPADLIPAIRRGLESGSPAVLDVVVDKEVVAPVTNFEKSVGRTI
jgi:acetolactate synthase-1/2/3 large subunit